MSEADISLFIDHTIQRHTPQLEKIDILPVHPCNRMVGVGQADKRDLFSMPVTLKDFCVIGTQRQYLGIPSDEPLIIVPQARQLRAAVRSHEASQKGKHDRLAPAIIGETYAVAVHIFEFEIGGGFARDDQLIHYLFSSLSSRYRRTFSRLIFPSMCFAGWDDKNKSRMKDEL